MTQTVTFADAQGLRQRKHDAQGQDICKEHQALGHAGAVVFGIVTFLLLVLMAAVFSIGPNLLLPEIARSSAATFTKLAGSMDDVVWLMPFLVGSLRKKVTHGVVYCGLFAVEVCLCSAITAAFAIVVRFLLPQHLSSKGWDVPCVMQLAGGALLACYAVKLFVEWRSDNEDGDEGPDSGKLGVQELLVIGVLGSLDDMCLQATTLASGAFAFHQLLFGVILGCLVVVSICWGASQLKCILKIAEFVPLWSVVAMLALSSVGGVLFS